MKCQRIIAAFAAASLAVGSGAAFAQPERGRDARDHAQRDQAQRDPQRGDRRGGGDRFQRRDDRSAYSRHDRGTYPRHDGRRDLDRRDYSRHDDHRGRVHSDDRGRYRAGEWRHDGRGAGPAHNWYRGGRLPPYYRSRTYVVDDWRGHRLYAPPRGYHWVQAGGDYVLVAIASGIIASILLNQ